MMKVTGGELDCPGVSNDVSHIPLALPGVPDVLVWFWESSFLQMIRSPGAMVIVGRERALMIFTM